MNDPKGAADRNGLRPYSSRCANHTTNASTGMASASPYSLEVSAGESSSMNSASYAPRVKPPS